MVVAGALDTADALEMPPDPDPLYTALLCVLRLGSPVILYLFARSAIIRASTSGPGGTGGVPSGAINGYGLSMSRDRSGKRRAGGSWEGSREGAREREGSRE